MHLSAVGSRVRPVISFPCNGFTTTLYHKKFSGRVEFMGMAARVVGLDSFFHAMRALKKEASFTELLILLYHTSP